MRCLFLIAVVLAMAAARPETYREKEDFQYSRSSSDEGSKSGYYGAQRGNMGGNYERAHNMDSLAQHQMSGLIHQVDGELGDASNTKTGSVYTAANSRGIYGSGHYDLGNLEGRNFQEGTSYGNSHSQSALTNSAYRDHSANENRYRNSNSYSHSSRQSNSERSEYEQHEGAQSSHLRSGDNAYQQEYGVYDGSSRLSHSASPYQNRLVSTRPMKILVRPGTRVTAPIATQTYDADHSASSYNADNRASSYNADHSASSYDSSLYNQHAAKSDAELIANTAKESHNRQVPANKHYESSYNYHKEWEKHDNSPGAVPLGIDENSIPKTSELYDDSQHSQAYNNRNQQYTSNTAGSHNSHLSNSYGYNAKSNLASSSRSRQQSEYDLQREKLNSDFNAFTSNAHQTNFDANQQRTTNSKPKSYESSYAYHKSWERQGDPYVIVPVPDVKNGQSSQRLTDSNSHNGYSSHQYGSNHKSSHQSYSSSNGLMDCDCDDEGHIRVARSYNTDQEVQQQQNGWEVDDQQSQNQWDKIQDLGQHTQNKWDKIEDLGQQSQNQWDKIEDLGQQTQNQWDNIEDPGQQRQNKWDKIEDLGQQSQNQWDKIQDLGQQTQNAWDKSEDLGQQTQNQWDKIKDLGQQTQNQWDNIEDPGQQRQNKWDKTEDLGQQQSQSQWDKIEDLGQQTQSRWDKIDDAGQQSQNQWDKEDFSQHHWENQNLLNQQPQSSDQDQNTWRNIETSHKQSDTNNYESQGASSSSFEDKNTDIFQSQNIFRETTTNLPQNNDERNNHSQNSQHFYDHENKHFWYSEQSPFNTNMNTISNGETHTTDKQPSLDEEQTGLQNNYLHQQVTKNTSSDERTQHASSINNLWDKLDRLDRESLNNFYNPNEYNTLDNEDQPSHKKEITTTETSEHFVKTPKHPKDMGRGDIETEDTNFELHTNFDKHDNDSKEYSTTQKEALSLSTNQNNGTHTQHDSSDKKRTDEKFSDRKVQPENINHDVILHDHQDDYRYLNKEPQQQAKHEEIYNEQRFNQNNLMYTKPDENIDQQIMHHHFDSINQQNDNLDHQKTQQGRQYFDDTNDFDQQQSNQNVEDFGPINENFEQSNVHHNFQYSDNHYVHQNMKNLDQQQFDQGFTDKFGQENMEQYLQSFDKYKENFDQKTSNEQLRDFSKSSDDFFQQSVNNQFETFNKQNKNLDQQNIEQTLQNFDKFGDNFGQVNLDQNLEDFSNMNKNYDQQSINNHYYSFHPESDNMERFGKNNIFGQHNTNQDFDNEKLNEKLEVEIPREYFDQRNQDPNSARKLSSSQNAVQNDSQNSVTNIYEDKKNVSHELTTVASKSEQEFWASVGITMVKPKENFYQQNQDQNSGQEIKIPSHNATQSESQNSVTNIHEDKKNVTHKSISQESTLTTVAPAPEQPGFWASVGKKFSKAKDKVSSWFRKTSD